MTDHHYHWHPFSVSEAAPLPMLEPAPLDLPHRLLLSAPTAETLALGLGRVDMDIKWMWRWSTNGRLSLYRSWTGFEIFRMQMRPVDVIPAPTEWEVADAWAEGSERRYQPSGPPGLDLAGLLSSLADVPDWLGNLPDSRAAALAATRGPDARAIFAPQLLAEQLNWQLPALLSSLRLGDREFQPDQPTTLLRAVADGDALRLEFDDEDTVLWLQQAHDTQIERGRLSARTGGVLLWPSAGFLLDHFVSALVLPAAWELGTVGLRLHDLDGEELSADVLPLATDPEPYVIDVRLAPPAAGAARAARAAPEPAARRQLLTEGWASEERAPANRRKSEADYAPGGVQSLALEIARCPEIPIAWSDGVHPCHKIVRVQEDRPAAKRHLPEAWAGTPGTAKVVFLSSNPSISDAGDATSGAVEEDYPRPGWADDRVVDFMTRRFGPPAAGAPDWTDDDRFLRRDGTWSPKKVAYWTRARSRATELLGQPATAHSDYFMTEVVHCKSKQEVGVARAASLCSQRYLDRVLSLTSTPLITVVGSRARNTLRDLGLVPESFGGKGAPPWSDIHAAVLGGRPRLLVYLPHFTSMEPRQTYQARYGKHGLELLRAIASAGGEHRHIDWQVELQKP